VSGASGTGYIWGVTSSEDEQRIRQLEDERYDAVTRLDVDAFEALCHVDMFYTHSSGLTDSLGTYAGKLRAGYYTYGPIEHPVDRLVLHGDVALVLGRMNADIIAGGNEKRLRNNTLAVWQRSAQDWKLLAVQSTPTS
jgi:hypothetical protein